MNTLLSVTAVLEAASGHTHSAPGFTLMVDGKPAADGKLARTVPLRFSADETLDIGEDTGTPASEDYHVPFKFTGDLKKVMIELSDNKLTAAEEEELRKAKEEIAITD
jgi:arylsulfatase